MSEPTPTPSGLAHVLTNRGEANSSPPFGDGGENRARRTTGSGLLGSMGDPVAGTVIADRYRLIERVGEGGMGAVYRGEHLTLRKPVAVKFLHPELSRVSEVVGRFEREALAAAHLEHPNVVAAHDFGKTADGTFFLVMEFVNGRSLADVLQESRRFEPGRVVTIARQMAAALSRAHSMGIVHRDLKPDNVVLLEKDGVKDFVKVLDFGIAKVAGGTLGGGPVTQAGMVFGTPEYMPPEQALGAQVDHRADLYAFGVMIFEMLAGRRPFVHTDVMALLSQHLTAPVPSVIEVANDPTLPLAVDDVVRKMLAKSPNDRYPSAQEAVDALCEALGFAAANVVDRLSVTGPSPLVRLADTSAKHTSSFATDKTGPAPALVLPNSPIAPSNPPAPPVSLRARTVSMMEGLDRVVTRASGVFREGAGDRARQWSLGIGGGLALLGVLSFAWISGSGNNANDPSLYAGARPVVPVKPSPVDPHIGHGNPAPRPPEPGANGNTEPGPPVNGNTDAVIDPGHGSSITSLMANVDAGAPVIEDAGPAMPTVDPAERLAADMAEFMNQPGISSLVHSRGTQQRQMAINFFNEKRQSNPNDAFSHYYAGMFYAKERGHNADMVSAYARAIELRADLVYDDNLVRDLVREVTGNKSPAPGAEELIKVKLALRARPILLETVMTTKAPPTRARAVALLSDPSIGDPADRTVQLLLALATAGGECASRVPVIDRLGQLADRRALPYLQAIPTRVQYCQGAAPRCQTCAAEALNRAISGIELREGLPVTVPDPAPRSQP